MDNLDTLFNKKEYELILKLTDMSKDPKDLMMRILCLIVLGKTDEALDEIEKNQLIIEKSKHLKLLEKAHLELLLSKNLIDEAKIAMSHYENLPYVSQEIEEFNKEMKDKIEDESHPKNNKNINIDDIYEILENETENSKISQILFSLKNFNVNIYIESLKIFLKRPEINPNLRTYGLILLVDQKYDEEIEFLSQEKLIKINPSKITPPFVEKAYNEVCKNIVNFSENNVTLIETSMHLLNCYIIDTYPLNIYDVNSELLSKAILLIGRSYLKMEDIEENKEIIELSNKIRKIIESTPILKM